MLDKIDIKNGKVLVNRFINCHLELDYNSFLDGEILLKLDYSEYVIIVEFEKGVLFNILILKDDDENDPIVKQEVGDYESLVFVVRNYIGLLASFKESISSTNVYKG
ncbi:hypothetical protein MZM54_04165 [[Brevibacterium] frigoritolerans]|nr:hypothetical protein [Peribacillus frigoritolerans]